MSLRQAPYSLEQIDDTIRTAARRTGNGTSTAVVERFLRTGETSWQVSGQFGDLHEYAIYSEHAKAAICSVFHDLGNLLPIEHRTIPPVPKNTIRNRITPMVKGLVPHDWCYKALAELTRRTFVLTFDGAKAAIEAELSTGWLHQAWAILWTYYGDFGLKPEYIEIGWEGFATGNFSHIKWSAYNTSDPYSDVVVHESAHLLHYLKPRHYGLHVRLGQERFVDVAFRDRELFAFACEAYSRVVCCKDRKSRIAFADDMQRSATSFPASNLDDVAALVSQAARARNGWKVIRHATEDAPPGR